ncbi:MAG: hypothetical protein H6658_04445 [Ardenticatenaceae bacterium]|nr:hypothetical protein [Ardenticatenaceae bacterium]
MDKAIITTMLIVISMVTGILLFNAAYPAIIESSDAMTSMTSRVDEQMKSQISIIHSAGELDSAGWWQDTNSNGNFDIFVWTKNVGATRITAVDQADIFFGPEGNFVRIPHQSQAGGTYPYWDWQVENASEWLPTATLKITIHYGTPLPSGRYFLKVTTPNGIADDHFFSM